MTVWTIKCVIVLVVLAVILHQSKCQTTKATCYTKAVGLPPSCLDKYAVIPNHVNCLNSKYSGRPQTPDPTEDVEIVNAHNDIRSNVNPKAGNMLELHYSNGLESSARRWVQKCITEPNTWYERTTPGAFNPGQNTYVSDSKISWTEVIQIWQAENTSFTFGGTNDVKLTSNYTQMIWADTATVGCAVSECHIDTTFWYYVCHYAPVFDERTYNTPYASASASCEKCPLHCNTNGTSALCDCSGALCLGGSTLDLDTCQCNCIKEVNKYNGTLCELICDPNGDDSACGTGNLTKATCGTNLDTMFHCPWLCDICPYAGDGYAQGSELLPWQKGLPECTTTTTTTTVPTTTLSTAKPANSGATQAATTTRGSTPGPGANNRQQQGGGGNTATRGQPLTALSLFLLVNIAMLFSHDGY